MVRSHTKQVLQIAGLLCLFSQTDAYYVTRRFPIQLKQLHISRRVESATTRLSALPPSLVRNETPDNSIESSVYADYDDASYNPPSFLRTTVSPSVARLILAVVAAFYGTNFGCVKLLEETLSPSNTAAARFILASSLLLPFAIATRPNRSLIGPLLGGIEVGLWCCVAYAAQAISLETGNAGKSAFICALSVLVVPFLDAAKGNPPPLRTWIAALAATFGVSLLELGDSAAPFTSADALSLLQPIFFGIGFWRMEAYGRRFPRDALPLAAGSVLIVALGATLLALGDAGAFASVGPALAGQVSAAAALEAAVGSVGEGLRAAGGQVANAASGAGVIVGTMAWTGFASTAGTNLGETVALTELSAAEATIILATEPLWGAAFAYVALGEQLSPVALLGGAIVVASCVWSSLGRNAPDAPEDEDLAAERP